MKVAILIPARMESTRFPGKALVDILGTSLIMRVYHQAMKSWASPDVYVATDSPDIANHVTSNGGKVILTASHHISGTDRIIEAASKIDADIIINVQGDEPLIDPEQINQLITLLQRDMVLIGTMCTPIYTSTELFDYNVVKLVKTNSDKVLYFSRQAIPAHRDLKYEEWINNAQYYKHLGIYGFKKLALDAIKALPPSRLENAESLEQLKWLDNGLDVYCTISNHQCIGVDIPDDVDKVVALLVKENFDQILKEGDL